MRCIDNFAKVFPRLWSVWFIALDIGFTVLEIFAEPLTAHLSRNERLLAHLALLVCALVARALAQQSLQDGEPRGEH